jgi:hypothetical protein
MSEKWNRKWERPMRSLDEHEGVIVDNMIGVYTGWRSYNFNRLLVFPVIDFFKVLFKGNVF